METHGPIGPNRPNGRQRTEYRPTRRNAKALASGAADRVFGAHGGYRKLKAYQLSELLYDYTCRFCDRYIPRTDRHHDQMVQAGRSGYQNIAEGSEDSATSRKLELNLTNVAKGSIGELMKDYQKYLKRRGLRLWQAGEPRFEEARALRPETVEDAVAWVNAPGRRKLPRRARPTSAPFSLRRRTT